ncbi:head GIN domain-containing protein [Tateyamaria omphalii]|uniref:Putative auto-transporter adhesin head GIN domain-containing protein n=1 Tax=Tateyamaria omphalii TaxID=299262 RepID=A0A1P8MT18_9RHOB|nr:head GIN domain-containing protein [Tateyamaria omphalii]APX11184.1 hypothetical protein BWR18_05390 [Tateyamaria omphalii]
MRPSCYVVSALCAVALASPLAARETVHNLTGFSKIVASDHVKVEVFSGSDFSVVSDVSGTARAQRLVVEQDGDTLVISRKGRSSMILMGMADYYTVTVHLPALTAITANRGVYVEASGTFPDMFQAKTSSGAEVDVDGLEAANVILAASSGSDLDVRGTCGSLLVEASSGSEIDAEDFECKDVEAKASSGADIEVYATGALLARASSGGDIDVGGAPVDTKINESSGGDVSLPGS